MPRIRPDIIQATEDNLPNAYLEPRWPEHIPQTCQQCGSQLHPKINLSYGLGRAGRTCKTIAHWISLPWAVFVLLIGPYLFSLGGNGGAFALGIMFMVPAVLFSFIGSICPRTCRVQCFRCKYSKDYPYNPQSPPDANSPPTKK